MENALHQDENFVLSRLNLETGEKEYRYGGGWWGTDISKAWRRSERMWEMAVWQRRSWQIGTKIENISCVNQ